jgi:hypothetical protein
MRPFFMSYVLCDDRGQALLPALLEDYGSAVSAVRVIDTPFFDGLDVRGL